MPSIADLYETVDAKRASHAVFIAGNPLSGVRSIDWAFTFGQVPTCTIVLANPPPAYVALFAPVQVLVGFNGLTQTVFTGAVESVARKESGAIIECVGKSRKLEVPYERIVVTLNNIAANTAVTNLLAAAGITDYAANLPAWQIGTVVVQTLEFQTYGEAINKIAEVDGSPWYEMPSGQVRVEVKDPLPAPSAFRNYFSMVLTALVEAYPTGIVAGRPRLRTTEHRTYPREVKNRVFVRGAILETIGPEGESNSNEIETSCSALSPWVPNPPGYADYIFQNELIDTTAKTAQVCSRYVILMNRLEARLSVAVDGDPQLFLGATERVEDPSYSGITGNWFLYGYSCHLDSSDFQSQLDLRGGGPAAGSTPLIDPFADFTWANQKVRQVAGAGLRVLVTFTSTSEDFDGSIVSWVWSDDQGNSGTGPVVTFVYDPGAISSAQVTLVVTDNDGLTDSITKTVNVVGDDTAEGGGPILVPTIYCAAQNTAMCSDDGGLTWNDLTPGAAGASGLFISVSGKKDLTDGSTVGIFGTDAGELVRTTDLCVTGAVVLTVPGGPDFLVVWKDEWVRHEWWAGTDDGRLYRSTDNGATWYLYRDFLDGFPIAGIGTPEAGGVWVYGGDTSVVDTLVRFDPDKTGTFFPLPISGALADAAIAAGAGNYVKGAASKEVDELALIFSGGVDPGIWYTFDIWTSDAWAPGTGIDPGLLTGLTIAPGYDFAEFLGFFNNRDDYYATDGLTYAKRVNVLGVGIVCNHLFWERRQKCVYLGAATDGIIKTTDCGVTFGYQRPNAVVGTTWPAGAVGRQLSFEAFPVEEVNPGSPGLNVYAITSQAVGAWDYLELAEGPAWVEPDAAPPADSWKIRSFGIPVGAGAWLMYHMVLGGTPKRSTDRGATWANSATPSGGKTTCWDIDRGADNRLWAIWGTGVTRGSPGDMGIFYSDDDGATWVLSLDLPNPNTRPFGIACHPTDTTRVAATGWHASSTAARIIVTINGGTSWVTNVFSGNLTDSDVSLMALWIAATGGDPDRLILCRVLGATATPTELWYSDDDGVTWINAFDGAFTSLWRQLLRCGSFGILFALLSAAGDGDDTHMLLRSTDRGETWTYVGTPVAMSDGSATFKGLAYDLATDTLFVSLFLNERLYSLTPASSGGASDWTDRQYNILDFAADRMELKGICMVPKTV